MENRTDKKIPKLSKLTQAIIWLVAGWFVAIWLIEIYYTNWIGSVLMICLFVYTIFIIVYISTQMSEQQKKLTKGFFIGLFWLAICAFGIFFCWKMADSYQNEMDYVCFNNECAYIQAKDYSVNWEGTCLTINNSSGSSKECDGTIDIVKPYGSFWARVEAVWASMAQNSSNTANQ